MKPFFTAEEIEKKILQKLHSANANTWGTELPKFIADYCNAKLEREGKRVCGHNDETWIEYKPHPHTLHTHTALLVCEEELNK